VEGRSSIREQAVLIGPVERQIEFGKTRRSEFDGLPAFQDRLDQLGAQKGEVDEAPDIATGDAVALGQFPQRSRASGGKLLEVSSRSRQRHDVGLDIHLHEPGEMGLFNVQEICARTRALGLAGKVAISHGFCLGGITELKAVKAAETMAEAGVALVTHGAGGLTMPPIEMLRAAGVLVFAGNDDIRDTWSPYGTGDLLERAARIG
jgi:cytosine/adenosine deaminase-related metal-dependent hydrolase